ncbi:hypothetical protein F1559_000001 [Cyanidiococcus yangmingshanensis]|uniref:Uncharacterized protein n=1 Tax=Cyanidiococcus yangmingshanensis TaxID=2690220 RepID=A0A7J7IDI6_9RHOD|nr:hypothetical protein F1559_000001 [Cyanidiococcus yangmingshanensis]
MLDSSRTPPRRVRAMPHRCYAGVASALIPTVNSNERTRRYQKPRQRRAISKLDARAPAIPRSAQVRASPMECIWPSGANTQRSLDAPYRHRDHSSSLGWARNRREHVDRGVDGRYYPVLAKTHTLARTIQSQVQNICV